jgi:hypothetical protein
MVGLHVKLPLGATDEAIFTIETASELGLILVAHLGRGETVRQEWKLESVVRNLFAQHKPTEPLRQWPATQQAKHLRVHQGSSNSSGETYLAHAGGLSAEKICNKRTGRMKAVPIDQIDWNSKEVVATFPSIRKASEASGFKIHAITAAMKAQNEYEGFLWRKVGDDQPMIGARPKIFAVKQTKGKKSGSVSIEQIDPETNTVVQYFPSILQAEKVDRQYSQCYEYARTQSWGLFVEQSCSKRWR